MALTLNTEAIRLITLFENMTGTRVKDCVIDNASNIVYFIIDEGMVGIAIGKDGSNVKNVENMIKKNIKIFEFSKDVTEFVKKLMPNVNEVRIRNENGKVIVEIRVEKKNRALIIGRDGKNLKLYKELLQRNHHVDDLILR